MECCNYTNLQNVPRIISHKTINFIELEEGKNVERKEEPKTEMKVL